MWHTINNYEVQERCKRTAIVQSAAGLFKGEYFYNPPEVIYQCAWCFRPMKAPRKLPQRSAIGFKPSRGHIQNAKSNPGGV